MGQKINPIGLRLGINRTWDSRWYANTGEYGKLLHEDIKIREYLEKELKQAAVLAGVRVPARIPGAVDAEAKTDRIDFLAHQAASPFTSTSRTTIVRCENGFSTRLARPRPREWNRFMTIDLPT